MMPAVVAVLATSATASTASAGAGDAASKAASEKVSYAPAGPWSQIQGGAAHLGVMQPNPMDPGSVPEPPAPPYGQAWRFDPTDSAGVSGPVISGETVYALGEKSVYAVDLATGEARWSVSREAGPMTVPAIAQSDSQGTGSILVYTQGMGADTALVGLDVSNQKQVWSLPLEDDAIGDIALDGGTSFVGNSSGKVFAVDVATGKIIWAEEPIKGRVESAPAVAGGVVYAAVRSSQTASLMMLALDEETGAKRWEAKLGVPGTVASGLSVTGSSVLTAVFSQIYSDLRSLSTKDGSLQWTSATRSASLLALVRSYPAVSDGRAYVTDITGGTYGMDVASGRRAWDFQMDGTFQLRASPVAIGGYVVSGFDDGHLAAFSASNGHKVWVTDTGAGALKSIAAASGILVVGKGGDEGGLVAFKHSDGGKLLDVVSPTTMAAGKVALAYLSAMLLMGAVLLGLGKLVNQRLRRFAAPEVDEFDEEGGEEQ